MEEERNIALLLSAPINFNFLGFSLQPSVRPKLCPIRERCVSAKNELSESRERFRWRLRFRFDPIEKMRISTLDSMTNSDTSECSFASFVIAGHLLYNAVLLTLLNSDPIFFMDATLLGAGQFDMLTMVTVKSSEMLFSRFHFDRASHFANIFFLRGDEKCLEK